MGCWGFANLFIGNAGTFSLFSEKSSPMFHYITSLIHFKSLEAIFPCDMEKKWKIFPNLTKKVPTNSMQGMSGLLFFGSVQGTVSFCCWERREFLPENGSCFSADIRSLPVWKFCVCSIEIPSACSAVIRHLFRLFQPQGFQPRCFSSVYFCEGMLGYCGLMLPGMKRAAGLT